MMVPLGLWVGIIGYAVLYSGVIKLGGGQCSLAQAFRGQCVPAAPIAGGSTTASTAAARTGQQLSSLPTVPVMA